MRTVEPLSQDEHNTLTPEQSGYHLRGGTPYELYQWPYYVSVAHSKLYVHGKQKALYSAHLLVLCVKPYRVVYVSQPLQLHPYFERTEQPHQFRMQRTFFYPTSLTIEDADTIHVGGHINDVLSVILRFTGVRALFRQIIRTDTHRRIPHGLRPGELQRHVHHVMQRALNMRFVH